MAVKVSVFLTENVLKQVDEAARQSHTSRSAFLTQAAQHFLEVKGAERRMERRQRAAADMDRLREEFGGWDGAAEIVEWRDRHTDDGTRATSL